MREIKFRAWDKTTKKYWNIDKWHFEDEYLDLIEPGVSICDSHIKQIWRKRRDVELTQYTGLKDVNGKDIYEGDIVNVTWSRYDTEGRNYAIAYDPNNDGYPAFDFVDWYEDMNGLSCAYIDGQITVIGNRFENPELLEVTE